MSHVLEELFVTLLRGLFGTAGLPLVSAAPILVLFPALHIKNVPLLWSFGFVAEILLWLQQGILTLPVAVSREQETIWEIVAKPQSFRWVLATTSEFSEHL